MQTLAPGGHRHALLIGIDRYVGFPPLAGCVHDVEVMSELLRQRFGFPADNLRCLLDEQATADGIRAAFAGLNERLAVGDIVVVHYSGHGSQMTHRLAPGGMEETIVPVDSGRAPQPNREIGDLEIRLWLLQLASRAAAVSLIFDSCHSGHILRDPFGAVGRWWPPAGRPVSELPSLPDEILREARLRGPAGLARDAEAGDMGDGYRSPLSSRYTLLAGCRSNETSFEIPAPEAGQAHHGAFTYYLTQELAKADAQTTFRDVFEVAAPRVSSRYSTQHPQIEGARDQRLFGDAPLEPMRFLPVRQENGRVVLGAGAACGMTAGSTWAVYAPGTKTLNSGEDVLGRLEVTQVRAVDSLAKVVEGTLPEVGG